VSFYQTKGRIIQTWTNKTCHTEMIFHKRLSEGWQNVSAVTYSLSIHLQIQFLMLTLTDVYRNVHVILELLLIFSVGSCIYVTGLSRLFVASWLDVEQHWLKIACMGWRWFTSMHRNDTVEHVITEAVLKRRDSSGNRKIHLVFTDLLLSFEIIQYNII
jgi:hypothetical protein